MKVVVRLWLGGRQVRTSRLHSVRAHTHTQEGRLSDSSFIIVDKKRFLVGDVLIQVNSVRNSQQRPVE